MTRPNVIVEILSDQESLLTQEKKRKLAEWYKKQDAGIDPYQKPSENKSKEQEVREEKPSWLARKAPGMQKKIREMVDTLLPRRHRKT